MNPELHRYLDGEVPRAALSPEQAAEADRWETALAETGWRDERAPAWLEDRVMSRVPHAPPQPAWRRLWRWLVEPRTVRLRPVSVAAGGAVVALLVALWPQPITAPGPVPADGVSATAAAVDGVATTVYIRFAYSAPEAESVAVSGDFNGWSTAGDLLRDPDGDGVWTGTIPLAPGVHKYMFVVNGSEWVTDPQAERYIDDGFGMRNAVIAVNTPAPWQSS